MDMYANDNCYSQEMEKIDRKIESTVSEVSKFLRDFLDQNISSKTGKRKENDDENRELINFFQTLLYFLHENPGFEELLLPHVGELRLQNGLNLSTYPVRPCSCIEGAKNHDGKGHKRMTTSVISLWELLSSHLEDYISRKLTLLFDLPIWSEMRSQVWLSYLNTLHTIWTPTRLWEFHKKMRKQYFQHFRCPCDIGHSERYCLECLMLACLQCLTEDAEMVGMGCFQPSVITWTELYNLYSEKISAFVTKLVCGFSRAFDDPTKSTLPQVVKCLAKSRAHCQGELMSLQRRLAVIEPIDRQRFYRVDDGNDNVGNFQRNMQDILLKMIEILNFYDKQVMLLAGTEALTSKSSLKGALTALPDTSPEESPLHQQYACSEDFTFLWDWKSLLVKEGLLTIVQKLLQHQASKLIQDNIQKEWELVQATKELCIVRTTHQNTTYSVMKSIAIITEELDKYLPVLAVSQNVLLPFQSSFNHVIHAYLIDIFNHLQRLTADGSINRIFAVLSSSVFLQLKLSMYILYMTGSDRATSLEESAIGTIYKRLEDEIENFKLKVVTWHSKVLVCGILHDAESHDWQNNKAFFECERVSFSIQMWNLFMKAKRHHLFEMLPPKFAQEVYCRLLEESLFVFESRYARARPSEARVQQFRADITCILLCVIDLLPFACTSVEEFLGMPVPEIPESDGSVLAIHSHCCALLMTLAIVTCPVPNLFRAFKKGFPQVPINSRKTKRLSMHFSRWLHWIQPQLFPQGGFITPTVQVWLCTNLCILQPIVSPFLVIQALTMHSCILTLLLVTQSVQQHHISESQLTVFCSAVLLVLNHCYHQPESISNIMGPIIQSSKGWDVLNGCDAIASPWNTRPWWYGCLKELVTPMVKSVMCSTLPKYLQQSDVLSMSSFEEWRTVYLHMRRVIRCCCNNPLATNRSTVKFACCLELVRFLVDYVRMLPNPSLVSLEALDSYLRKANSSIKFLWDCIGLHLIADVMYNSLKSTEILGKYLGMELSDASIQFCQEVANCFLFLVSPKGKLEDQNPPPWCSDSVHLCLSQVQKIFKSHRPDASNKPDSVDEIYEKGCLEIMVTNILQDDIGSETISYLHKVLYANKDWIKQNLGILDDLPDTSPLQTNASPCQVNDTGLISDLDSKNVVNTEKDQMKCILPECTITLDTEETSAVGQCNVLKEFCKIGSSVFDHAHLLAFNYSWDSLMPYLLLLGLTETTFCALLDHRWDMNETMFLSDSDKEDIEFLKTMYALEKP